MRQAITLLALASAVAAFGCKPAIQKPNAVSHDLPEPVELRVPPAELQDIRRKAAVRFLEHAAQTMAGFFGDPLLAAAQIPPARSRLAGEHFRDDLAPLSLFGAHGLDANGVPYVDLFVLNEHRESTAIWLFIQPLSGEVRGVRIALPLKCKGAEYILAHHILIEPTAWTVLEQETDRDDSGVLKLTASSHSKVAESPRPRRTA